MDFNKLDNEVKVDVIVKKQNKIQKQEKIGENKKVFSFTLRPSLVKKLEIAAKNEDRSKSKMLEKILEEYFKEKENNMEMLK